MGNAYLHIDLSEFAEDSPHISGDGGNLMLVVRKDSAGTLAGSDGDYAPLQVDANGNLRVSQIADPSAVVSSSAVTSVASSASNVTLLASNTSRKMATFFNDSTQVLYLKFGATASNSSYTVQIPANGYFELPRPTYTGIIDGIWASANGNVRITELT